MGIKVSAGLSSHLNALRKNPRPGLRLLAASTQFLAAVGLRRSVPVGSQQGALSERIQAPPIPPHGPPHRQAASACVQPSRCLRQPQAGPPRSSPARPPLTPSPPALCKGRGQREPVYIWDVPPLSASPQRALGRGTVGAGSRPWGPRVTA